MVCLNGFFFNIYSNAFWSVTTLICFPYKHFLKYIIDQTTPKSSNSLKLSISSHEFRNLDVNAMGFHSSTVICSKAAPSLAPDASLLTRFLSCGL